MAYQSTIGAVRFTESDFTVNHPMLIGLNHPELTIVLFHTQNDVSVSIARIWHRIASHIVGPRFGMCDVLTEYSVDTAFMQLKSDPSHPFYPYSQHTWPIILAYRDRIPVAMYRSSDISQERIIFWALSIWTPYTTTPQGVTTAFYRSVTVIYMPYYHLSRCHHLHAHD